MPASYSARFYTTSDCSGTFTMVGGAIGECTNGIRRVCGHDGVGAQLSGAIVVYTLLPLLAYIPALSVLLPASIKEGGAERDMASDRYAVRYWAIQHAVLIAAFIAGVGLEALLLWYIPSRLVTCWLLFIFAWYPHHPADGKIGRYVDTRVAVFPGSTFIVRGHDYHALHHLFPRVVAYNLPKLWQEIGPEMTAKGVRTEGRALGATGPITW